MLRHALSIGRDAENDIVLPKTTVSRRHATLLFVEGRWLIGLAGLSGVLGSNSVRLDESNRKHVEDAVKDSSFELLTGKDDRLLRKLSLMFELDTDVPDELRQELGRDAVGARFEFDLALDDVNQPVAIG